MRVQSFRSAALILWTLDPQLWTQPQRCAPGRADRFQTCPTGFDSSHRCLSNCRRGSTQKGAGPVNRIMRVRIPPSALSPCGCDGQHGSLRNCRTRFDSSTGHLLHDTFSECAGFARDPAKVEDQVRLLARTLFISTTRHRCSMAGRLPAKQLRVSSILTGVSLMLALMLSLPAVRWAQELA